MCLLFSCKTYQHVSPSFHWNQLSMDIEDIAMDQQILAQWLVIRQHSAMLKIQ